jgi:hypothetical protein
MVGAPAAFPESVEPADRALRRLQDEMWSRRRQLERQVHDGAALRLSALTLRLGLIPHKSVRELQEQLNAALQELRAVAAQLYPPLLGVAGVGPAVTELAHRENLDLEMVASEDRFGEVVEGTIYFALAQWLGSGVGVSQRARVSLYRDQNDHLVMTVAPFSVQQLTAIRNHVRPLDGWVEIVQSGASDEDSMMVCVPCA